MGELTPPRGTNELAGLVHLPHKSIASPILMRERGKRNGNKTQPKPPDSLRREASQAAGAAPTLRYGPAGDSAPRLRLKASGMAESKLSASPHNMNDNILYHA